MDAIQTQEEKMDAVVNLMQTVEEDFVQLGQLLNELKKVKAFRIRGYAKFKEFIESEFNIKNSFASKLISNYILFVEKMQVDDLTIKNIGLEKLNMIKPIIKKEDDREKSELWIDKAEDLTATSLREEIKEYKNKQKTKSMREIYVDQYVEKMVTFFDCKKRDLDFKLALYFQDKDLDIVRVIIDQNQEKFDEEARDKTI